MHMKTRIIMLMDQWGRRSYTLIVNLWILKNSGILHVDHPVLCS